MLSADPRTTETPLPRARRPTVATRELLFAMATPPLGRVRGPLADLARSGRVDLAPPPRPCPTDSNPE